MKPYTLTAAGKYIAFTTLLACFSLLSRAQTETPAGANASIGMLSGRKSGAQAKLAAVKDEIQTFTVAVLEPHNKDAAEQRSAMAALEAGGYDATSQASVNAYNQRLAELDAWGKRVEERRIRETPRYVDMKTREAEYTQLAQEACP